MVQMSIFPKQKKSHRCRKQTMVTKEGKGEGDKLTHFYTLFPGGSDGKASACNAGDSGSIPGLGRSPGEGNATHSSILAWRIPQTEEHGRLQSMGSQRVDMTE